MKSNFKRTVLLSLSLSFILAGTVYASEKYPSPPAGIQKQQDNNMKEMIERKKGHFFFKSAYSILVNKYNVKPEEITKAKEEGKTVFDIAKTKGIAADQLKSMIIAPRLRAIDEMAATGELSKEKAEKIKGRMKELIDTWDGKIEDLKHRGNVENKQDNINNKQAS